MRKFLRTLIPILIFVCGIGILFYPVFSDLWNQHRQNSLINTYIEAAEKLTPEDYSVWKTAAAAYNAALDPAFPSAFTGKQPDADDVYWSLLNLDGSGIMGYIEIPKISVRLALYHGTGEAALQHGIGHLAGTSLPVGGAGTHTALSGHRGLPSALLFTDLDKVRKGDHFYITVLNRTLAYEVDRISVVKPDQTKELSVQPGKDLVTLVTCTPYGVNTQRLLVRGHRVPYNAAQAKHEAADSAVSSFTVYGFVATYGTLAIALAGIAVLRRNAAARTPHHAADWPHSLTVSVR